MGRLTVHQGDKWYPVLLFVRSHFKIEEPFISLTGIRLRIKLFSCFTKMYFQQKIDILVFMKRKSVIGDPWKKDDLFQIYYTAFKFLMQR